MSDALTGKTAKRQLALAEEAQRAQREQIAKQQADLDAVEAGQRNLLTSGAGGMLAFIDKRRKAQADEALKSTFGGGATA
jgi:hypothetical protein